MATSNAATTYLERRVLDFIFKNNSLSFATPNNDIYVGLATGANSAEFGKVTEVRVDTQDANYTRQQVTSANWKQSTTTLAVALTTGATEIILTDAEAFPVSGTGRSVIIDDEIITYTGKDGTATANVNGAVSSSANVAVDGNSGNSIAVGMVVTGTGISGTVRVVTVTNQNNIVLSSAVSLSDDVALNFDGTNTLTGGTRGASSTTAATHTASTVVVCDSQRVINDNNIEYAAAAGTTNTYIVAKAFIADKNIATAVVNGAVSSSVNVAVDGNSGTIAVGDVVTGTGISGVVRVATVNSQTSIALDTAVSIANDIVLMFDGSNILFVGDLDASKTIAVGDIFRINAGNLSIELQ